jgi:hypothetical protein
VRTQSPTQVARFTTMTYAGILFAPAAIGWFAELVGLTLARNADPASDHGRDRGRQGNPAHRSPRGTGRRRPHSIAWQVWHLTRFRTITCPN